MKLGQVIKKGSGDEEDLQSPGENSHHHSPVDHGQERAKILVPPMMRVPGASPPGSPFRLPKNLFGEQVGRRRQIGLYTKKSSSTILQKDPPSFLSNRVGYNPLSKWR
jgi:hypothetical protein